MVLGLAEGLRRGGAGRIDAVLLFRVVLIGGFLVMLAANMPGQLSVDSVIQLHEARAHVRETWAPAIFSAVLGLFDRVIPGTGLYLVASGGLTLCALLALRGLRPRMSWAAPVVALAVTLSPMMLIYQGIIWKDVLFANLAVGGFVLLGHIVKSWASADRPWLKLLLLALMLGAAAQVRQNGLVVGGFAALVLAWTARSAGWRSSVAWGLGALASILIASQTLGVISLPKGAEHAGGFDTGLKVLQRYDIIGALAHDKTLRLEDIAAADPNAERMIRLRGVRLYSAERIDYLGLDPAFNDSVKHLDPQVSSNQWRHLILHHPGAYLAHRWDVFRWVVLTPMIDSCLPLYTGVTGPPEKLVDLGIPAAVDPVDQHLFNYGTWFLDTPVMSHVTYLLICAASIPLLLQRREPQDIAMIGLVLSALAFTASFFVISVACDYRYLYFLDLAAATALIYLAIDPPLPMRSRR